MKNVRDVHKNNRSIKQHRTGTSGLKRAGVLLLCLLILITSDSRIIATLTVQAEEEENVVFAITSFMPLPEETAQQIVSVGTSEEELMLPDTLTAAGTYEEAQKSESESEDEEPEKSGDKDNDSEKTDEGDKTPTQPEDEENSPSDSEAGDKVPENPNDGDNNPELPEESDKVPENPNAGDNNAGMPEEGDKNPEKPNTGDDNSEKLDEGDKAPENPEDGDNNTEIPDQSDKAPEKPNGGDDNSEVSDQSDKTPENPNAADGVSAEPNEGDVSSEQPEGNNTAPEDATSAEEAPEITEASETNKVYVDVLDQMVSSAKEKMFTLFGDVSTEETRVAIAPNMSESEPNPDVQTLTQTVSISPVTWECISEYDNKTVGCYLFTPILPEGFTLADEVTLPEIVVIISEQKTQSSMQKTAQVRVQAEPPTSGSCGSGVNWSYENGTLTISGSGPMDDFSGDAPWQDYNEVIERVVIGSGVTSIGNYAFFEYSSLQSVEIPDSIVLIGNYAFFKCSSLQSVGIPNNIAAIGTAAFFECASLGAVEIPNNVSISDLAFNGCSGLTFIELPAAIGTVAVTAFRNCPNAFLYYPSSQSGLSATKNTRANIEYTVYGSDTSLKITSVASGLNAIRFPKMIGNGRVWESNWSAYPSIAITHESYPDHRYADGSSACAICGYQKAPEITIDYINETLIGFENGKTYSYSIAGVSDTLTAGADSKLSIEETWFGKTMSIAIQGAGQSAGNAQPLDIPARPDKPAGITAQGVSASGNDGKLLGVTAAMEYSTNKDSGYTHITGETVDGLLAGTYYVRFAAVDNKGGTGSFCSLPVEVTVEKHELKPEDKPNAGIDYLNETLIGLIGGAGYRIGIIGQSSVDMAAQADGTIELKNPEWFGQTISIIKAGDNKNTTDSEAQALPISTRPAAPAKTGKTDATSGKEDGTLTGVSVTMEYRPAGTGQWIGITGTTVSGLKPGKYEIRYKARAEEKKFASEIATQVIGSADMTREDKPIAVIDFVNETLTRLKAGETYLIDGTEMTAEPGGIIELEEEWLNSTLSIVKMGNYATTLDSEEQSLEVPPRPEAPKGVAATPVTTTGGKDGKLINLDATMEYLSEDDENAKWKNVAGKEVTGLSPGTYIVRFKATKTSFHSEETELVVQDAELKPETKPEAKIDYKNEKLTKLIKGATYTISDQNGGSLTDEDLKADKEGNIAIDESWMGIDVRIVKVGNSIYTQDSEEQLLAIPERPGAPTGVTAVDESGKGAKDGQLTNVDDTMEYQKDGAAKWTAISQTTVSRLAAGVYYVRYKAVEGDNGSFCSDSVSCAIAAYELQQAPEPDAEISYVDEYFISLDPGASYKINGTKLTTDDLGRVKIKSAWMTGKAISIIKSGDGLTTADSPKQSITVPKRRSAPAGVKAVSESEKDSNDGKLTGVSDEMEYRRANGEWTSIDGDTLEDLEPGVYEIRYAYTADQFVSKSVKKTVYAYGKEPKAPKQNKNEDPEAKDSNEDQQPSGDGQDTSSQNGKTAGSGSANTVSGNSLVNKNNGQAPEEIQADTDKNIPQDDAKDSADSKFIGTAIADSEDDSDHDKGDSSGSGQNKGSAAASGDKNGDSTDAVQSGTEQATSNYGQYVESGAVYTERAAGRMSTFYNFILDLANSDNLIWIAIILAEPILFLLILLHVLERKKRDAECQT